MHAPPIRDAQALLGALEDGDFLPEASRAIRETLQELNDQSMDRPNVTLKGHVTLKLNLAVKNGLCEVATDISTKTPKAARKTSSFWTLPNGELSTEHPRQKSLFGGPREVPDLSPKTAPADTASASTATA